MDGFSSSVSRISDGVEDLEALKSIAIFYGIFPQEIEKLMADGFTTDDIEEMLYCG